MVSREQLISLVILFAGIFLATLGPKAVESDAAALASVVVGIVLALGGPVVVFGPQGLWRRTGSQRTQIVHYRASVVGWYVTIAALLAAGLSVDYLPEALSMETVVWGLFAVGLAARIGSKLYFQRRVSDGGPTAT